MASPNQSLIETSDDICQARHKSRVLGEIELLLELSTNFF